jgi:hypothetical protein
VSAGVGRIVRPTEATTGTRWLPDREVRIDGNPCSVGAAAQTIAACIRFEMRSSRTECQGSGTRLLLT